jgi:aromatic ring-cleaving dioxygenase
MVEKKGKKKTKKMGLMTKEVKINPKFEPMFRVDFVNGYYSQELHNMMRNKFCSILFNFEKKNF